MIKNPVLTFGSRDELAADMRLERKVLSLIVGFRLVWYLEGLHRYLLSVFSSCINDWSKESS